MQWVEPAVAIEHQGITIYHIYVNDLINQGPRDYWYGYTETCDDEGFDSFDIRDLANYSQDITHKEILREAIEQGYLIQEGPVSMANA